MLGPDIEREQAELVRMEVPPVGRGSQDPPSHHQTAVGAVHALREVVQVGGQLAGLRADHHVHRTYQVTEQGSLIRWLETIQKTIYHIEGCSEFSLDSINVPQRNEVIQANHQYKTLENVIKKTVYVEVCDTVQRNNDDKSDTVVVVSPQEATLSGDGGQQRHVVALAEHGDTVE